MLMDGQIAFCRTGMHLENKRSRHIHVQERVFVEVPQRMYFETKEMHSTTLNEKGPRSSGLLSTMLRIQRSSKLSLPVWTSLPATTT